MFDLTDDEILALSRQHVFYTWSAQAKVDPIAVKRARGVYFWDIAEKRYLDFNSMTMCVNIGHGDERVIRAMQEQAAELPYAAPGMTTRARALASKMVAEITPHGALTKVLFTLGGADANENAIKLARGYTGRHKILARYRSYHGATAGAMAATGDPRRVAWEPNLMTGVVHFLDPYRYRSTFHRTNPEVSEADFTQDYLNHLEEIIRYEGPGTIAAVLMEAVTGTNGIIIPPEGYLQGVRRLCDKYGIVMIADEVMSGFGRTGKWFAVEHWDVVPDMITMAKGLTSAYAPLGAVAMKPEIAAAFNEHAFESGLTYTSHPVSLAAAIADICREKLPNSPPLKDGPGSVGAGFLKVLAENQRLGVLPDILARFEVLKAEAERTLDVLLTSASAVSDAQQQRIVDALNKRFGRQIRLTVQLDPTLIGGARLQVGDRVIDGSVRTGLDKLATALRA